jgi:hypothetical protein
MAPTTIEHLRTLLDGVGIIPPVAIRNELATCLYIYLRQKKSAVWDTDPDPERLAFTPISRVHRATYGMTLMLYTSGVGWEHILRSDAKPDAKDAFKGMLQAALRALREGSSLPGDG